MWRIDRNVNTLILATDNAGKIKELQSLLSPMTCIPQSNYAMPSIEETGLTFIENALLKARHACIYGKKPALADDSGLVVPVLNGAPGIYSARFAGNQATSQQNIALLLNKMQGIPHEQRHAYFYCALVLLQDPNDPTPLIATGMIHGEITLHPQGGDGFGYDPVFYVPQYQRTMAELPMTLKNKISHRALALKQFTSRLFGQDSRNGNRP